MNLARLRLVTFDVTETLLQFRNPPGKQYGEIAALYGVCCDSDKLAKNFKEQWRKISKDHPNFGHSSGLGWEKWWKTIVHATFKTSCDRNVEDTKLEAISEHLIEAYKTSQCWQQCYGALGLLSYLRNRSIPLGVISNFDQRLPVTLHNNKMKHYFKFILTSYDVGVEKPDGRIFNEALKLAKISDLKPEECLHVGDTPTLDYFGARNAGWNAALVFETPTEIQEKYPEIDQQHVYRNLYELHKYFVDCDDKKVNGLKI